MDLLPTVFRSDTTDLPGTDFSAFSGSGSVSGTISTTTSIPTTTTIKAQTSKATAMNHLSNETPGIKQPVRELDVSLTHTTAYLSISVKEKKRSKLSCDEVFKAKVHFSSKPDQEFYLHYHALSK